MEPSKKDPAAPPSKEEGLPKFVAPAEKSAAAKYAPSEALVARAKAEQERRRRRAERGPWVYIRQMPTEKQRIFLESTENEVLFGGAVGGGKELYVNTHIPTPTGWTTMGEIKTGDFVLAVDGTPARVLEVSPIHHGHASFEVVFSDGSVIVANHEHLWETTNYHERSNAARRTPEAREARKRSRLKEQEKRAALRASTPGKDGGKGKAPKPWLAAANAARALEKQAAGELLSEARATVVTTEQIRATLMAGKALNHAVRVAEPLQLPHADLPIDPYVLGVWLGDGTTATGNFAKHKNDLPMVERLKARWPEEVFQREQTRTTIWRPAGLTTALRALGVLNNKHIPQAYLRASFEQRLELLRGLLDTDGGIENGGQVGFTTTSPGIRDGMTELLATLGIASKPTEGRAMLNGEDYGPKWRWKFVTDLEVFTLPRKAEKQKRDGLRGVHKWRYIAEVRPVPSVPMRCIRIDHPSHLYLAGREMIPTHNSSAVLMAALQYVHVRGYTALILRRTHRDLALPTAIMARAHDWLAGTDAKWNDKDKQYSFPNGAKITFGYCDNEQDKYRYQGIELQFLGIDEVTQWPEGWYKYLLSRMRKQVDVDVPLRVRVSGNPGGIGHEWVKQRFIDYSGPDRKFIPSLLDDNPYIDKPTYEKMLLELDPTLYKQLRHGVWVRDAGGLVYNLRSDNLIYEMPDCSRFVIGIDYGFTEATAFVVLGWRENDKTVYVLDARTEHKLTPSEAAERVKMLSDRYRPDRIVGDIGGLGKGYIEEAKRRFQLPIHAAQKNNKRGYLDMANGAIVHGEVKIFAPACQELIDEMNKLPWRIDRSMPESGFSDHCCFVAGTMVMTPTGERPIETLRVGDSVMTSKGSRRVIAAAPTGIREIWKLETSDGRTLLGTGDHPIFVDGEGMVRLDSLRYGCRLHVWQKQHRQPKQSSSSESNTEDTRSREGEKCDCILWPPEENGCIGPYGKSTTSDQCLKDAISTTWMGIQQTTTSKISSALRPANTCAHICCLKNEGQRRAVISITLERPQQSGTDRQKALHSTRSSASNPGMGACQPNENASFAQQCSHQGEATPTSALQSATPNNDETPDWMTSRKPAPSAAQSSDRINTANRHAVPCLVLRTSKTGYVDRVFNLTVEGEHEYYANGIRTSNCDAFLYGWRECRAFYEQYAPAEIPEEQKVQRFAEQMKAEAFKRVRERERRIGSGAAWRGRYGFGR